MLVTEKEARKTLCCGPITYMDPDWKYCGGSDCMAWRWYDPAMKFVVTKTRYEIAAEMDVPVEQVECGEGKSIPFPNRRGFCGLAGKPEVTE